MNKFLMCGAAGILLANASWGQESGSDKVETLELDTIDVAGLRPTSKDSLTTSISTLDAEDLLIRNAPNVVDQLRAVPGIGVSSSGGPGALTQVRIRGAEANHTLVLLDGIEISDPTTGETDFGLLTGIPTTRVDVLRGEQSAIYGSDAIGGVVALQTGHDAQLNGLLEFGSRDTARAEISGLRSFDNAKIGGNLTGFTTRGVDTAGLDGEKDGSSSFGGSVFGSARLGTAAWELSGVALYRESDVETDPDLNFDGRLDNADRDTESEQFILGASLAGDTGPLDHIFRASYNSVTRENYADGQLTDDTTGERTKVSWSPSITLSTAHQFSGLVDFESEDYERRSNDTFFGDPNQSASFDTVGIAAEYRGQFADRFDVSASVRHDLNDNRFKDTTTWRVGAAFQFDFDGRLRASVGTGVKNPTFTELFGFFPASFIGNPELEPEQSLGWEIGWDQVLDTVTLSATYFEADLEDEIFTSFVFDPNTGSFNSSPLNRSLDSKRSGLELGASWAATKTLSISGSASFIDSQNDTNTDEIRVPSETASLSLNWNSDRYEDLRVGFAFDYVGGQLDTDFGTFQTVELDDYTLVSATAEIPFSPRVSFTLRGVNLFDEDVVDVIGFNSPGRGLYVGFKLR